MAKNKKISGYGSGSVDVVMSVDQVAKEAAAISKSAPKVTDLNKPVSYTHLTLPTKCSV